MLLIEAIGRRAIVSTQHPILLGDLSAPQPDIAILKPRDAFDSSGPPQAADVLLVIKVADSSVRDERNRKLPLYARNASQAAEPEEPACGRSPLNPSLTAVPMADAHKCRCPRPAACVDCLL
ncbi:Uma2 family endonuclease [Thiocapsa imhoffii]|uniref:Uma2 family endonuclease n=1 Tax=Thiocapsa imhoffii TaxID=382777 RepID=UPI001904B244|nr:Uma2 family endonuclease [Thiocapsa imhoffii]